MDENGWEWMRMNEDEWEWMRMDENGWESTLDQDDEPLLVFWWIL